MYFIEYDKTKKEFAKRLEKTLNKAINKKKFKNKADFVRQLSKQLCIEEASTSTRLYEWLKGEKSIPAIETCIKICQLLDVDLDYLLGHTDPENRDIDFIQKETGLTEDNIKKLRAYNNGSETYNFLRLNAINMILSSEKGLQIIEAIAKYLVIEPEYLMVETRGEASSSGEFAVIASSAAGAITINKDDIPAIYLTAITKLLTEWKSNL